ncbi:MAG TPA: nucleoside deaminase [Xanthobacteraceae bacterium]|nr:nucleoside deaminase [Xanthobacteraceae bacterium]
MMRRCIEIAVQSGRDGEYPYGAVLTRAGKVVVESINRVAHEHNVTRHAEAESISLTQKILGTASLSDCVLYTTAEPCVYCAYAIRESRLGRVVYALHSSYMGGASRWNVLTDQGLSEKMPEVFDPPPEVVAGLMAQETEDALLEWNPLVWGFVKRRGLFVTGPHARFTAPSSTKISTRIMRQLMPLLRTLVFNRFGRRL